MVKSVTVFRYIILNAFIFVSLHSHAGPFPPAAGVSGTTAVAHNDSGIVGWAMAYSNYSFTSDVDPSFQTPEKSLGAAGNSTAGLNDFTFDIVSIGRGGQITLTFEKPITNGEGVDFAVFENGFSDDFLELAFVEVSSDGINFTRFPVASLTSSAVGAFGTVDTTNILGFAGKYRAGFGTPFDLNDLAGASNLDINNITHIKIIDVVGDGTSLDNLTAPVGPNPIYDPYPTSISAGFDLDAIAVMHFADVEEVPVNVPVPYFYLFLLSVPFVLTHKRLKQNSIR